MAIPRKAAHNGGVSLTIYPVLSTWKVHPAIPNKARKRLTWLTHAEL